jgi:hypothetical protein
MLAEASAWRRDHHDPDNIKKKVKEKKKPKTIEYYWEKIAEALGGVLEENGTMDTTPLYQDPIRAIILNSRAYCDNVQCMQCLLRVAERYVDCSDAINAGGAWSQGDCNRLATFDSLFCVPKPRNPDPHP